VGLSREEEHTIEISRPNKGNVDTEVAMVGRAVKAQVDGERDGGPCWVLLAAVEADLYAHEEVVVSILSTDCRGDPRGNVG